MAEYDEAWNPHEKKSYNNGSWKTKGRVMGDVNVINERCFVLFSVYIGDDTILVLRVICFIKPWVQDLIMN